MLVKRCGGLIGVLMSLGLVGCASTSTQAGIPMQTPLIPATQVVTKTVVARPPARQMAYQLSYENDPVLAKAYQKYLSTGEAPNIETDGFTLFAYGSTTEPIVAAHYNQQTVISLEPGEKVTNVTTGDPQRWSYSLAISGDGAQKQYNVLLKPQAPVNMSTDMVITTNKRLYTLKLVSITDSDKFVKNVRFWYPEEAQAVWNDDANTAASDDTKDNTVQSLPNLDVNSLNFNYQIAPQSTGFMSNTPSWTPNRVFDDGTHTYIQFPGNIGSRDLPALFVQNAQGNELVNYRFKSPYFVVDSVFKQGILLMGVGKNQTKVTITNLSYR